MTCSDKFWQPHRPRATIAEALAIISKSRGHHKGVSNVAQRCDMCGKAPASGSNVSHSNRHTKRRFRPNIQRASILLEGEPIRLKVCTRCLRSFYKAGK